MDAHPTKEEQAKMVQVSAEQNNEAAALTGMESRADSPGSTWQSHFAERKTSSIARILFSASQFTCG